MLSVIISKSSLQKTFSWYMMGVNKAYKICIKLIRQNHVYVATNILLH